MKPKIYLLVIFPVVYGGGFLLILASLYAFVHIRGVDIAYIPRGNALFITIPAFIFWVPLGLMLSNFIMYVIHPMRRIAESFVKGAGRPDFKASQKLLLKAVWWISLPSLIVIALGFYL